MLAAGVRSDLPEKDRLALFSGHSLRAGLASSAEVDERYVQKQLGHASAEMTRRYQRRRDRFRVNLTKSRGVVRGCAIPGSMRGLEDAWPRPHSARISTCGTLLMSEIANFYGIPGTSRRKPGPGDRDRLAPGSARASGAAAGEIRADCHWRSGYRSSQGHGFGNEAPPWGERGKIQCRLSHLGHAQWRWSQRMPPPASSFPGSRDRYAEGADWRALAWWIHDHLPYSHLEFYPKLCAFNILWSEQPNAGSTVSLRPEAA